VFGFDLLTLGSVNAEVLQWTICLLTLVLLAQDVFSLEHGQTDTTERPTHAGGCTVSVGNSNLTHNAPDTYRQVDCVSECPVDCGSKT